MWQTIALSMTFLGAVIIYLTNKNQQFIKLPLSKRWRLVGYSSLLLAFVAWLPVQVFSAALFLWLFTCSTALIVIPLLSLTMLNASHKKPIKGKS